MPTVGSTSEPTTGQVGYGLNVTNQYGSLLTMPGGGPWIITKLGAWAGGWNEACTVKLCVWSEGGNLLASSGPQTASNRGNIAQGANDKLEGNVTANVSGGQKLYVGFSRDPADNVQFGTRSGTRKQRYASGWPADLNPWDSVSGEIGAWIADYESANVKPNAPTNLQPTGSELVNTGRTITYSGTRSDPDSGDYVDGYEIEVYTDGGTLIWSSGIANTSGTPTSFSTPRTLPSGHNAGGPYYEWRARTRDSGKLWGAWSGKQRFRPNSVPATPAAPSVETDTLSPIIGGSFSDADPGNTLAGIEVHVETVSASVDTWLSGEIAKTAAPWTVTYAGSALAWGTQYRARYRTKDNLGAWSAWGAFVNFTPVQPLGPSAMSPKSTTPRQTSLTPTLTIAHSATFRNDEIEVYVENSLTSTKLWTKAPDGADYAAVTTKARTYAGAALAWGTTYYWRARIEDTSGVLSSWSALYPFRTNALPTAPALSVATDAGVPAVLNANGTLVTTDTTPVLSAPFDDPDLDAGDTAGARSIEVRRKDTGAALAGYPVTTGTTATHTLATALTADVVYEARWGYRDAAGQPAGSYVYSAWVPIKASAAPGATTTGPASPVTDSTPVMAWTFAGAGGKTQAGYQVKIFDRGPTGDLYPDGEQEIHDSGPRAGAALSYGVPPLVLSDLHDYRWELTVADTDGLTKVVP